MRREKAARLENRRLTVTAAATRMSLRWKKRFSSANIAMGVIILNYPSVLLPSGLARESALKTIGGNIRRERSAALISQEKLATLAGLNVRTLAKIEAGGLNVRPETLDNIRRAIGCSLRSILGPYGAQPMTRTTGLSFLQKWRGTERSENPPCSL